MRESIRTAILLTAIALTPVRAAAQIDYESGVPATFSHEPSGAVDAPGSTQVFQSPAGVWHFKYDGAAFGDEVIDYVIDTTHLDVRTGLIRVHEQGFTNQVVLQKAGLAWRTALGAVDTPESHSSQCTTTLVHQLVDAGTLTMTFHEQRASGSVGLKTYEYSLKGKVLKIRVRADPAFNNLHLDNYAGFQIGTTTAPPLSNVDPENRTIPYMDSVPIAHFASTGTVRDTYRACFVDWYRSNAQQVKTFHWTTGTPGGPDLWFGPDYVANGEVATERLSAIDDTINLIVTRRIRSVFPRIPHARSPYYELLRERMVFNATNDAVFAWKGYRRMCEKFAQWGLVDVTGIMWGWQKYTGNVMDADQDQAGVLACEPQSITVESATPLDVSAATGSDLFNGYPIANVPTPENLWIVDVDRQENRDLVRQEFGAVMAAARANGWPMSLYQIADALDPQGFGPYYNSQYGQQGPYPLFGFAPFDPIPLWTTGWMLPGSMAPKGPNGLPVTLAGLDALAIKTPSINPGYYHLQPEAYADVACYVRPGEPQFGWDTSFNLASSSWFDPASTSRGRGHATHVVSPDNLFDHLARTPDSLNLPASEKPTAVFIDAYGDVHEEYRIDFMASSPKPHTIRSSMHVRRDALQAYKRYIGGPMLGENAAWRRAQFESFETGLWDGRHRNFATAVQPGQDPLSIRDSWVIPDYELRMVAPLATGHHGMGWEQQFDLDVGSPSLPMPLGKADAASTAFLDEWATTTVTYGHSAFTSTAGLSEFTARTCEAMIREYHLITPVQAKARQSTVSVIEYFDPAAPSNPPKQLDEALSLGPTVIDLKHPLIRVRYANGFDLYANHQSGGADWDITVPYVDPSTSVATQRSFKLPPHSFLATDGAGLLVFSARNPDSSSNPAARIDYARVPGRGRFIACRGVAQTFESFPSGADVVPNFLTATTIRDDVSHVRIGARRGLWNIVYDNGVADSWAPGAGKVVTVPIAATPQYSIDVRGGGVDLAWRTELGASAIALDANNPLMERNVTPLATWTVSSGPAGIATVNGNGAVYATGAGTGQIKVRATWDPDGAGPMTSVTAESASITVVTGMPTPNGGPDHAITIGDTTTFDASSSSDPQGFDLGYEWQFGDGSSPAAGRIASHTYRKPGNHTALLSVTDREGNTPAPDQVAVVVSNPGGELWADRFGSSRLDAFTWSPSNSVWGVIDGVLTQSASTAGFNPIAIAGESWLHGDFQVKVKLGASGAQAPRRIGLHLRKTNDADTPQVSGYTVDVNASGTLQILEATNGVAAVRASITDATFDSATWHTLRAVVRPGANPGEVDVTAYLDATVSITWTDASPYAGGGIGLTTQNMTGSFDDLIVKP